VVRSGYEARTRAAAETAALLAFMVSAAIDWVWQVPVLPVAFLVLAAAVLAPRVSGRAAARPAARLAIRGTMAVVAVTCLVAIAVPLATATAVGASQRAAASGNATLALTDAEQAVRVDPSSASAQIQLALVEELRHDLPAALSAARHAVSDEPQGWTGWLILARLDAEAGKPKASLAAFARARSLNPRSPVFANA
jgi:tetratricopeptide (TPR) repeat protein